MLMLFPGCCFSLASACTTSPLISVEFCHSRAFRVLGTTSLGVLFM